MRHPFAALTLVLAGALLVPAARAQTCEQFRDTLAARVDPGIRGFAMEIVPGTAPVPAGAKVFGTCEGGARKILFFRNGHPAGAGPATAIVAATPASAPTAASGASAPAAKAKSAAVAPAASVASAPTAAAVVPAKAERVVPAPTPTPVPPVVVKGTAPMAPTRTEPPPQAEPVTAVASEAASWPALRAVTEPASTPVDAASGATAPGLLGRLWPWFAGVAGLLGLLFLAGWIAHRRAYDASGLPRGPRLKP